MLDEPSMERTQKSSFACLPLPGVLAHVFPHVALVKSAQSPLVSQAIRFLAALHTAAFHRLSGLPEHLSAQRLLELPGFAIGSNSLLSTQGHE